MTPSIDESPSKHILFILTTRYCPSIAVSSGWTTRCHSLNEMEPHPELEEEVEPLVEATNEPRNICFKFAQELAGEECQSFSTSN